MKKTKEISKNVVNELAGCFKDMIPKGKRGVPFEIVRKETINKVARYLANK